MTPYYGPYWADENELEHHGVKGQRWGIRRYQNADGTLTIAGKLARRKATMQFAASNRKSAAAQNKSRHYSRKSEKIVPNPDIYPDREITDRDNQRSMKYARKSYKYSDIANTEMERGIKILRQMQKDFGTVAFKDMGTDLLNDAQMHLYIDVLHKRLPYTKK